ncbi:peptidoglycan-binding domain-containing protein [Arenibaculum sp.]|jgi:peptidoglycan hydrolase-like protein with peptidoglycan-binding domain|uniref:peptidoglycan-binding domain-containing protein n=1 Tax=Arenibaculum sp. TaxID=2865862 RepID=UPI002E158AC0|nr:peptidoglycan-binding domain-containing protein [Arenibaculum sp.]
MLRASVLALALALPAAGIAHAQADRFSTDERVVVPGYSIAALQRALRAAGYDPGPVDGAMGGKTRQAITNYQIDTGLRPTGEPSPSLFARLTGAEDTQAAALAHRPAPSPDLARLPQGESDLVADVQHSLRQMGYGVGTVTGELDAETRAAIRAFERAQDWPVTGQLTRRLFTALDIDVEGTAADVEGPASQRGWDTAGQEPLTSEERRLVPGIQRELAERGYDVGPEDGVYGPKVRDAIASFQEQAGVPVTGRPSPDLLARLQSMPQTDQLTRGDLERMDREELIRHVEFLLEERGYDTGPAGQPSETRTAEAIRRYERDRGLPVTGRPTVGLLQALRAENGETAQAPEQQPTPLTPEGLAGQILEGFGRSFQTPQQSEPR